ncbi:zf-TFIIB domain-containing protein [Pseudanabaena sp. PCC 6802]|uniref:TFIIB-type zinc ribbon-containing protein n=1 Tax=Pseudanabaena sp. PCC 6802 TaxID=118173 RepID=UPI001CECE02A|nr:zf-TFIIB domain-containing protein [Pseudanabaena sp. PCC 6802]
MATKNTMRICPICIIELVPADRQGIELDYCPQCRGIWLDRGELEKLIDQSITRYRDVSYGERSRNRDRYRDDYREDYREEHSGGHHDRYREEHHDSGHRGGRHYSGEHRRRSFLEDLLDFD